MSLKEYIPVYGDVPQVYGGTKDMLDKNKTALQRVGGAVRAGAGLYGIGTSLAGAATGLGTGAAIGTSGGPFAPITIPVGALAGMAIGAFTGGGLGKIGVKGAANVPKFIAKYGVRKPITKEAQQAAIKGGANPLLTRANAYVQNIPYNTSVALHKMNNFLTNPPAIHQYLTYGAVKSPQLVNDILNYNYSGDGKQYKDVTEDSSGNGSGGTSSRSIGNSGSSSGYSVGGLNGLNGLSPEQQADILQHIAKGGNTGVDDYSDYGRDLINRYMVNQSMMEPYRRNLQNYIRDYNTRADWAYNQDRELAALAGLTGNNAYAQMIGKNNALVNEANRLGLLKTSGEDLKKVGEGMDTLIGNMDLARQVGLPLSAANADTKMAQLAVNKMVADDRNKNRLDVAQYNGALKLQIAHEKAKIQMYLRSGNRRAANDSYKRLRALVQAANSGIPIETINAYTGLNIPANAQQTTGEVRLER